jgi:hypothetical protein
VVVGEAWAATPPRPTIDDPTRAAAASEPSIRRDERFETALFAWVLVVMG